MEVSAVALARTFAFLPTEELNPKGQVSPLDLLNEFGKRCQFSILPDITPKDFDPQKGIEFRLGRLGTINIERVTVLPRAIIVDTKSSTDDSDHVLEESLQWAASFVGLPSPAQIIRKSYWSQLIFTSNLRLPAIHPVFEKIADRISDRVSKNFRQTLQYELTSVVVNFDLLTAKLAPSYFSVERLADVPFSENRYFSNAPLSTNEHISLLQEFESALADNR